MSAPMPGASRRRYAVGMNSPSTSSPALPGQARIVIVGGGIAGCSTAYHLAKLGHTDVLLLEQGKLTSGTT